MTGISALFTGYEKWGLEANALPLGVVSSWRWTSDPAARARRATPSAVLAWDPHGQQAAASAPTAVDRQL